MSDLERAIAENEKSPDLAAVAMYHLEGFRRVLDRVSYWTRAKLLEESAKGYCRGCGERDGECEC